MHHFQNLICTLQLILEDEDSTDIEKLEQIEGTLDETLEDYYIFGENV